MLNAHYGLFRCLLTMFTLLAVLLLAGFVLALWARQGQAVAFDGWTGLFAFCAMIAYARCKKRGEDFTRSVFDLFMAGAANKPPADKQG